MNKLLIGLLIFGMVLIQLLIGGTRLVFSLPTYTVFAVAGVLTLFCFRRSTATPSLTCLIVSALFFSYILVRGALSPIDYLWWHDFTMVLACLLVYLITAFYITTPGRRKAVIIAFLSLAMLHVFVGLRQFAVGDEFMVFGFIRGSGIEYGRRASGMLIHSIHLAGYLEAVAVFALSLAFWSTWKTWARFVMGYIAVLCYVGIAITGSRGGYLSAAFSLFVFACFCLHAYRKVRPARFPKVLMITCAALVLVLGGAVLLMSQNEVLRQRLELISAQIEEQNRDVRIYNWQAAIDQFKLEPVFGTGAGTHLHYGRFFRRPQIQMDPQHAHSDYLELLAEYGIIGGIGMLAFLLAHLWSGLRAYGSVLRKELRDLSDYEPARHDVLALQIGCYSAIAAYLIHSITDFNLHIPGNALVFAFIFGLLASPGHTVSTGKAAAVSRAFRFALPVMGLYFLVVWTPKFAGEYWGEKARAAVRDSEFEDAILFSHKAAHVEERNPFIYFNMGGALRGAAMELDDVDLRREYFLEAAAAYAAALLIFPQDESTLVRLGQVLSSLGRFKEAEQAYLAAINLDPNLGRLHAHYAWHLALVGRQKEAEERLEQARKLAVHDDLTFIIEGSSLDPAAGEE